MTIIWHYLINKPYKHKVLGNDKIQLLIANYKNNINDIILYIESIWALMVGDRSSLAMKRHSLNWAPKILKLGQFKLV